VHIVDDEYIPDASMINHCPGSKANMKIENSYVSIVFRAFEDIPCGDELRYKYATQDTPMIHARALVCFCGNKRFRREYSVDLPLRSEDGRVYCLLFCTSSTRGNISHHSGVMCNGSTLANKGV
jgi:hypothetical protein